MGATGDKVKGENRPLYLVYVSLKYFVRYSTRIVSIIHLARYTFNYVKENGIWKIQHHHSSVMPEEIAMGKPITDDEVRGLFHLWNDALATLDPKAVATRYAKKGVLLPTVSDTPRTNFAEIEDYFINFLKLKPQGKIVESYVTKGTNWCQGKYSGITCANSFAKYSHLYPSLCCRCWNLRVHNECNGEKGERSLLFHLRIRRWPMEDQPPPLKYHA
jgi:hypothetical protein